MIQTAEIKPQPLLEEIIKDGPLFDVIIIGAGPAGLTAGIYCARARLKTLIIEKALVGGMVGTTNHIENYPGFPDGVNGIELVQRMEEQARRLGVIIYYGDVLKVANSTMIEIEGKKLSCKAIIIAAGTEMKKLGVPGEDALRGRGVSYCATCDGPFYKDKNIAVVGGGNAAVEEALYLTRFAKKVSIIHRRDKLRADKILAERAMNNPNIFILWNSVIESINGEKRVENITIKNVQTKVKTTIPLDGVFIYVGMKPDADFIRLKLKTDKDGFIKVNANMETSIPGIFACGDITQKPLRQVITAASDGAIAANSARMFIEGSK